jgi:hypothetical protein
MELVCDYRRLQGIVLRRPDHRDGPRQPFEAFVKSWTDEEWTWECFSWLRQAAK